MARQLSVLQRQVEVDVDPQLISQLTRKQSTLSVTEVKIHATVPEELEREMPNLKTRLPPSESSDQSLSSPDSLIVSQYISHAENSLSSVASEITSKGPRPKVSYGGVRSKKISPDDSDFDDDKVSDTFFILQVFSLSTHTTNRTL